MTTLDSTPPIANFTIYRGDTFVKTFRIKQRSTRQLQDLTGSTARMQLRSSQASDTIIHTFDLDVDEQLSTITLSLLDWTGITWTGGVYDLEVTYQGGVIETLFQGTMTVKGDISR